VKNWIKLPRFEGTASRQAHVRLPPGTYEREIGREGFFGPSTQMHHRHPPTGWTSWAGPLRPRALDLARLEAPAACPWQAVPVLGNAATQIRFWRTDGAMDHLVRNADGDDLLFFHQGGGDVFCDYGHVAVAEGDYLLLPRGTAWRLEASGPTAVLMIEATNDAYRLPEKGLVGAHAIFDPGVLDPPAIDDAFQAQWSEAETRVLVKRRGAVTTITYPFNPLDAVGWHGDLAPVRLNWRDIRPLTSARYHLPPSAHTTFLASRHVVCTFVPRPIESDPEALKLPFYHNNDDFDEMIFYHQGNFFSRDNIHPGMVTWHPCGFPHGPHPKAYQTAMQHARKETDEVAVMVDARDGLDLHPLPDGVEWPGYVDSWRPT